MYPAGLVAQWITRLTTDQKIPGSDPGKLVLILFFSDRFTFYQTFPIVDLGITLFFHVYCNQNDSLLICQL